jgi:hypothetical protein
MNRIDRHGAAHALKARLLHQLDQHPYRPAWWLPGPHAQTIWPNLLRPAPVVATTPERAETPDGDFLMLHNTWGDPKRPTVLVLHGLEGSARAVYVRCMLRRLQSIGWNCVAMEFRGCSDALNHAPRLYHSGETADLDFVVQYLLHTREISSLYVLGFSLGGNIIAKWLGEVGSDAPVRGAAVLSPPFDLRGSAAKIEDSLFGAYTRYFLRSLVRRAIAKHRQHPGRIDIERVIRARTIIEFDTHATAPLHGFRDAFDYYDQSSCIRFLPLVRVPTLLLAAQDDPYTPYETIPFETANRSPWIVPQFPRYGGHLGFVAGWWPLRPRFWAEDQTLRFFTGLESVLH